MAFLKVLKVELENGLPDLTGRKLHVILLHVVEKRSID